MKVQPQYMQNNDVKQLDFKDNSIASYEKQTLQNLLHIHIIPIFNTLYISNNSHPYPKITNNKM